jgi:hypothetical protein
MGNVPSVPGLLSPVYSHGDGEKQLEELSAAYFTAAKLVRECPSEKADVQRNFSQAAVVHCGNLGP